VIIDPPEGLDGGIQALRDLGDLGLLHRVERLAGPPNSHPAHMNARDNTHAYVSRAGGSSTSSGEGCPRY
jgi:hypothetical protein